MQRKGLSAVAGDIASDLAMEMGIPRDVGQAAVPPTADLLLHRLAIEVAALLHERDTGDPPLDKGLEARLRRVESRLANLGLSGTDQGR